MTDDCPTDSSRLNARIDESVLAPYAYCRCMCLRYSLATTLVGACHSIGAGGGVRRGWNLL